jgi:hypothetical protein
MKPRAPLQINVTRPFMPERDMMSGRDFVATSVDAKGAPVSLQKIVVPGDYNCLFYSIAAGYIEQVAEGHIDAVNHRANKVLMSAVRSSAADLRVIKNMDDQNVNIQRQLDRIARLAQDEATFFLRFQQEMRAIKNNRQPEQVQALIGAWMYVLGIAFKDIQLPTHDDKWDGWGVTEDANDLARLLGLNVNIYEQRTQSLVQVINSGGVAVPEIAVLHSGTHFDYLGQHNEFWNKLPSVAVVAASSNTAYLVKQRDSLFEKINVYAVGEKPSAKVEDRRHVYGKNISHSVDVSDQVKLDAMLAKEIDANPNKPVQVIVDEFNAKVAAELNKKSPKL